MGEDHHEEFVARWREWSADRRVGAALCACVAVAAGLAWWRAGSGGDASGIPPPARVSSTSIHLVSSTTTPAKIVVVDVVGAVHRPGVVRVASDARVVDAIEAAGGATPSADLARLNLAARVGDGARVAVPNLGEPPPPVDPAAVTGEATTGSSIAAGPVNLNRATAQQLDALPGIGPATAAAIVSDRDAHGPFRSVDDLARVRGIGPAKLARLHELVAV